MSRALQAGAHAYLFKDVGSAELLTTIRAVSHGGRYLPGAVGTKLDEATARPELTARELDVLRWIVRGSTNVQIAKELAASEEAIKSRIKIIFDKLGATTRARAAALGVKFGLVQPDGI